MFIYLISIISKFYFNIIDIDECADPSIAARCVANSECCNLPAHFVCKCNPGYEGDGEEHCQGIVVTFFFKIFIVQLTSDCII